MAYVLWWVLNIWHPALACAASNGAYIPAEAQARALCQGLRATAVNTPSVSEVPLQ